MCGRYSLTTPPEAMVRLFGLQTSPNLPARYNIAPTQRAPVILAQPAGARRLMSMRWGLVPPWSKNPAAGAPLINARAETVAEKPSFREAFQRRRCLVPADSYYEWIGQKGAKQPVRIQAPDQGVFAFAGLWEHWTPAPSGPPKPIANAGQAESIDSFTIVTTAAAPALQAIHHRMPVIVPPTLFDAWIDPTLSAGALQEIIDTAAADDFTAAAVSRRVSNVRNDDPGCIEPLPVQPDFENPEQEDLLI